MNEILVVDASVAVKWFVLEGGSDTAAELLARSIDFRAPALLLVESARAFQKREFLGDMPRDLVALAMADLRKYVARFYPVEELIDDALELARSVGHPVYDCLYLVLARRIEAKLVTADTKFAARFATTPHARHLVHLADWRP